MRQAGRSGAPSATRVTNTRGQQPHTESTVVSQTDSPGVKPILDLVAFRLLLVRNWPVILGCLLAGIGAGLLLTALSPKSYSASASGVVAVRGSNDIGGVLTGDNIAKSKAKQFQALAKSRTVAAQALKDAGIQGSPDAAAGAVTVAVPEDTAQINVTVQQPTAASAAKLANAWVAALSKSVESMSEVQTAPGSSSGESIISVKPYVTAPKPSAPSSPNLKLNLLLGAILGLTAALLLTLLRTKSDRRIRGSESVERDFGLSVVGTLPKRSDVTERAFLLDTLGKRASKEQFRSIESFNELRANLQFMSPDHPPRAIVVTSALPGEGKSTVAANLAVSIAESGRHVVLVDGDLRRPTVATSFGLVPNVGVTTCVLGQGSLDDCLQDVHGAPRLQVLTAGSTPPNPSEIVGSVAFATMIERLTEDAFVIIDAPPLLPVSDGAVMSRRFDGCLLVLDMQAATKDALTKALSVLDKVDANLLGVVLNRVPTGKLEASQYGYYGDKYYYYTSEPDGAARTAPAPSPGSERADTDIAAAQDTRPSGSSPSSATAGSTSEGVVPEQNSADGTSAGGLPEAPLRRRRRRG